MKIAKQVQDATEDKVETDQSSVITALVDQLKSLRAEKAEVKALVATQANSDQAVAAASPAARHQSSGPTVGQHHQQQVLFLRN